MRALVTGAAGFAGSHLVDHLIEQGDEVIAFIHPSDSDINLRPHGNRVTIITGDVREEKRCREAVYLTCPDTVFHLAGIAFVPVGDDPPERMMSVNLNGTLNFLEAVRRHQPEAKFILAGSAEVYGPLPETHHPVSEETPPSPISLYAHSKFFAERLVFFYRERHSVRGTVLRLFNHIGPRQSPKFAISSFAQQISRIRGKLIPPLLRVGNLEAMRDFTDVRDVARAYRLAAASPSDHFIFNICSGIEFSIQEILTRLIDLSGVHVEIEVDPDRLRPSDAKRYVGSAARAESELGWRPAISLDTTLQDILRSFSQ